MEIAPPSRLVWALAGAAVVGLALLTLFLVVGRDSPRGDGGQLSELAIARPDSVPLPELVVATESWGLADIRIWNLQDQMAGGATAADLDGDGLLDLVVANGDVAIYRSTGTGFELPQLLYLEDALGVTSTDLDADGLPDLLIARSVEDDLIVWGGSDGINLAENWERTSLAGAGASSGLLFGELSGDDTLDVVRLGRGDGDEPVPDVLWLGDGSRGFVPQELPVPDRFTLAGTITDADDDGLADIWLTRDLGWIHGPDSVLSRRGDPTGEWVDVAAELGVAKAIDGMGITIADLDNDGALDAYVSDLGDNEQLIHTGSGFSAAVDTGAARIRPPGAPDSVVSSSWASGPIDVNLDGILDLVVVGGGFPIGQVRNKIDGTIVGLGEPPAVLLGLGDGTYSDVWSELDLSVTVIARGMTIADFDGDGDDDILIVDRLGDLVALENRTPGSSVTVTTSQSCNALDPALSVDGYGVPFDRFTYGGSHGPSVIVGTPGADPDNPIAFTVETLDGRTWTTHVDRDGREQFEVRC